jgi:hypothetical protein
VGCDGVRGDSVEGLDPRVLRDPREELAPVYREIEIDFAHDDH